jgi:hypothetical protein
MNESSLSLGNGWQGDAYDLVRTHGYEINQARDVVVLRYFGFGHVRPFLDFLRLGWTPGSAVLKQLAAMIDPEFRRGLAVQPQFKFRIKRRGRGRPDKAFLQEFKDSAAAMSEGRSPKISFLENLWKWMCAAEDPEQFQSIYGEIQMTATLVRFDGRRGDKQDPEVKRRDCFFADLVRMYIDMFGPGSYASAIEAIADNMKDEVKKALEEATNRGDEIGIRNLKELQKTKWRKTIKDAYDGSRRR